LCIVHYLVPPCTIVTPTKRLHPFNSFITTHLHHTCSHPNHPSQLRYHGDTRTHLGPDHPNKRRNRIAGTSSANCSQLGCWVSFISSDTIFTVTDSRVVCMRGAPARKRLLGRSQASPHSAAEDRRRMFRPACGEGHCLLYRAGLAGEGSEFTQGFLFFLKLC
jgi:hypothetical protein